MSLAVWPSELPRSFLRQGFSQGFADGRLSTKMDAGPTKTRRRFSSAPRPIQAAMDLPLDGKMRLERFWDEETAGGSRPFLMPDPMTDGVALLTLGGLPILDQDGVPILNTAMWLVKFGDTAPSASNTAGIWYRVTFSLAVLP